MAYATKITISTGNKVSLNYQSQEVKVTLTYQLERDDGDLLAVVRDKTAELAQAHHAAWQTLRDAKVAATEATTAGVTATTPESPADPGEAVGTADAAVTIAPDIVPVPDEAVPDHAAVEPPSVEPIPIEPAPPAAPGQVAALDLLLKQVGWSEAERQIYLRERTCESLAELTASQAVQWLLELQRAVRLAAQHQRLEASLNGNRTNGTRTAS